MGNIVLSKEEKTEMRRFYTSQYQEALRNLKHIKAILDKLGPLESDDLGYEYQFNANSNKKTSLISKEQVNPDLKKSHTRGRKSLWGNFILNQLKEHNRPISYTELIETAITSFNLPEEKTKNVKQAITNSAFRLRVINKKIETFGLPGKKERFLCLTDWYSKGKLSTDYISKVPAH